MAQKSPAYQWYPKDILASSRVGEMTAEEECWYRRALDFCWVNETIPSDPEKLARLIGKGATKDGVRVVADMFIPSPKDATRMVHERQEIERVKQAEWREKSAQGGRASAGKRKNTKEITLEEGGSILVATKPQPDTQPNGNTPVFSLQSSNKIINTSAVENPKKPKTKKEQTGYPDDFTLTAEMRTWFAANCPRIDADKELEKFKQRCLASNKQYADWVAGWRTQMLNAEEWIKPSKDTQAPALKNEPTNFTMPFPKVKFGGVDDQKPKVYVRQDS